MSFVTTEERVDRLEALFGQFLTQMAVSDRKAEERHRLAEERNRAAEERMARFEQEMREFKNEMRESKRSLDKRWAELSDSMGTLIEDLVAPCGFRLAEAIFRTEQAQTCGIRVRRKHPQRLGESMELDLLAVGATQILIVEAKRRMNAEKAAQLRAKAASLADFFPDYASHQVHCAVASPYIEPSVVTFLNRERIYGVAMGEDAMEVVNLGQF